MVEKVNGSELMIGTPAAGRTKEVEMDGEASESTQTAAADTSSPSALRYDVDTEYCKLLDSYNSESHCEDESHANESGVSPDDVIASPTSEAAEEAENQLSITPSCPSCRTRNIELIRTRLELKRTKETNHGLMMQTRRMKAEKLSLLGRIQQLLDLVDEKESKLQQFIVSFQKHLRDSSQVISQMTKDREEWELCKWKLTRVAQASSDRCIQQQIELSEKEQRIKRLEQQLKKVESVGSYDSAIKSFSSEGCYSSDELTSPGTPITDRNGSGFKCASTPEIVPNGHVGDLNIPKLLSEIRHVPLTEWTKEHVIAWLDADMDMSAYVPGCSKNIKTGKDLLNSNVYSSLGIEMPLHRRKLRLAIEDLQNPSSVRYPKIASVTNEWVSNDWLNGLGLRQYDSAFKSQLIDGRVLWSLAKKDLEKYVSMNRKLHQSSVLCGVQLLRMLDFDKEELIDRQERSELNDNDLLVWTSHQVMEWLHRIDLQDYAVNVVESGINGGLIVLDRGFTAELFATTLGIPLTEADARRRLANKLEPRLQEARAALHAFKRTNSKRYSLFVRSFGGGLSKNNDSSFDDNHSWPRSFSLRGSLGRAFSRRAATKRPTTKADDPRRSSLYVVADTRTKATIPYSPSTPTVSIPDTPARTPQTVL